MPLVFGMSNQDLIEINMLKFYGRTLGQEERETSMPTLQISLIHIWFRMTSPA